MKYEVTLFYITNEEKCKNLSNLNSKFNPKNNKLPF